jgi:hypothetical protein
VGFFLDKSISISLSIRLSKRILTVVSQKTVPSCSSKSASKFRHLPEPATHRPHLDAQATAVYPGKATNCLPLRPLLPRPDRCRRRRRATLPRARRRACPSSIWPPPSLCRRIHPQVTLLQEWIDIGLLLAGRRLSGGMAEPLLRADCTGAVMPPWCPQA